MDTLKLIKDKERELQSLYARMDKDRNAVYLNEYTLTGVKGGLYENKQVPGTLSVTMNRPAVFANAVTSMLQFAKLTPRVEGMSDKENALIESFVNDSFYTIDQKLKKNKISSIKAWLANHVAIRGPVGARFTYRDDGTPECLPVDMRYTPYEQDKDSFSWVAPLFRRTADDIKREFPNAKVSGSSLLTVRDFWISDVNEVWVEDKKVDEQPNPYRVVPFVIEYPSAGFMLRDDNYNIHEAESIFFMVRGIWDEWNRLMSIQQTKAYELVKPPYTHEDTGGEAQPYPHEIGANLGYKAGEKPELMQAADVNRAFLEASGAIGKAMQEGSLSDSELGDVTLDRTAIWITKQTEIRNKILSPRLECMTNFMESAATLLIKMYQILKFDNPVPIGKAGYKKAYTPADLGDLEKYSIEYEAKTIDSQAQLANYSVGLSLKGTYPLREIYNIFGVDDIDGMLDSYYGEQADQASPVAFFFNRAARLIDLAEKETKDEKERLLFQAYIMAGRMVEEVQKSKMQATQGQASEGTGKLQAQPNQQGLLALPALAGGR